jgi:hypothetical protein
MSNRPYLKSAKFRFSVRARIGPSMHANTQSQDLNRPTQDSIDSTYTNGKIVAGGVTSLRCGGLLPFFFRAINPTQDSNLFRNLPRSVMFPFKFFKINTYAVSQKC